MIKLVMTTDGVDGNTDDGSGSRDYTAAVVLEQTLGHITHAKNLQALLPTDCGIRPTFVPVRYDVAWQLPGWSNWTLRAGARAAGQLLRQRRSGLRPDVMFVHTQVPAVLLGPWMRRIPTVVSLDATPLQYDQLGEFYAHDRGSVRIEQLKFDANRRCFERARHIVAWSRWAKEGLVEDYGIDPARITVIPPGVDIEQWRRESEAGQLDDTVRVLFVGGDLRRKGGDLLIEAVQRLRRDPALPAVELHLVTGADVRGEHGVIVHRGLTANSPELIAQYHRADIFCLPTLGDCLPMVLAEAAAAGLPLISTDVGAIREIVQPECTGELIRPGDREALEAALRRVVRDPSLRERYGSASRSLAEREHNARTNARRIAELLVSTAKTG